jgi:hypothetical protein
MNRSDWVFVGVRMYGLFLLVSAGLSLPTLLEASRVNAYQEFSAPVALWMSGLVSVVAHVLMGAALFLGAPTIERWLARKDARAG